METFGRKRKSLGGHSSAGRAPALQAGGRRFDPVWLHQDFWLGKWEDTSSWEETSLRTVL